MTYMACVQFPLYLYGIDANTDTQMLKIHHVIILNLEALENGINKDTGTLNKYEGDTFA